MILYPWIEQWATGDKREHHLLDRPRNVPTRTGLGVMAITFYLLLLVSGGNDIFATHFDLSINDITNTLRLLVFVLPPLAYLVTKRICLGLQRKDREKVLHGRETGTIVRTETGEFFEVHEPLDEYSRWTLVQHEDLQPLALPAGEDDNGVRRPGGRSSRLAHRLPKFYFEDRIAPVTPTELDEAHHAHDHAAHEVESRTETPAVTAGD
jgi:ubiquinol-cytochrome c reductase cytochrome b subunit